MKSMKSMMTRRRSRYVVLTLVLLAGAGVSARQMSQPMTNQLVQSPPILKPMIPVRVDVVLSRYQGDKKTTSMPFVILVSANERTSANPNQSLVATNVRMGVDVPAGMETRESTTGLRTTSPTFRNVGTNIDCSAETTEDGRYRLYLSIQDSSIYTPEGEARQALRVVTDPMAFRTFTSKNNLLLREGQTLQFTSATDRLTGEVVKVDVTVNVVK